MNILKYARGHTAPAVNKNTNKNRIEPHSNLGIRFRKLAMSMDKLYRISLKCVAPIERIEHDSFRKGHPSGLIWEVVFQLIEYNFRTLPPDFVTRLTEKTFSIRFGQPCLKSHAVTTPLKGQERAPCEDYEHILVLEILIIIN